LIVLFMIACGHNDKETPMSHSDAEGLWQQVREVPTPGTEGKSLPEIYTFRYQRDLITLRLLVISNATWASPDGVYTLKSRWQGNTLQYLAPAGQWADLATFEDGRFVVSGDGLKREYVRVTPSQVPEYNADILKADRPVFDYSHTMK
jgi:hypothetical protein